MQEWDKWLQRITDFLLSFDTEQANYNKKSFCGLCFKYANFCFELGLNYAEYATRALNALIHVYERMSFRGEVTPIHSALCKLALKTKQLTAVLPLIQDHYTNINAQETGIKAEQAILFFYYAGCVALALKIHDTAAQLLELAISTPSQAVHAASIEAYKKLVLINLISRGIEYSHPKYVSPSVHKMISMICGPYNKLASTFHDILINQQEAESLNKLISDNSALWMGDHNFGLIKQVQKALIKHRIRRLTNTYVTLSFNYIATSTGVKECEDFLTEMIVEGELTAKIDEEHKMVIFEEKDAQLNIDVLEDNCEDLLKQLREIENMIEVVSLDPRYIKHALPQSEKKQSLMA